MATEMVRAGGGRFPAVLKAPVTSELGGTSAMTIRAAHDARCNLVLQRRAPQAVASEKADLPCLDALNAIEFEHDRIPLTAVDARMVATLRSNDVLVASTICSHFDIAGAL